MWQTIRRSALNRHVHENAKLGVTLVSEIPFENGQIVCRDGVDVKTLEVMSYAASFPDSLIGDARNPGALNHQLQTSQ